MPHMSQRVPFVYPWLGSRVSVLCVLLMVTLFGCKQEQLEQLAKQVKEQTIDRVPAPMKVVRTGAFKLKIVDPIETNEANSRLIVIGDGRPNVLQLRSYQNMSTDKYPMILVQANTSASNLSQLSGQTLNATVYITASKYEPIWSCLDQSTASLTIASVQDEVIKADIRCDKLISTSEVSSPMSGSIEAVAVPEQVAALGINNLVTLASADKEMQ